MRKVKAICGMLGLILCLLASCAKVEDDPVLAVTPTTEVVLDPEGSTPSRVEITTNQESFEYACDADWLKIQKEGNALSLSAERTDQARTTTLTITAGTATPVKISVSQKEKLKVGDYYQGGIIFWLNPDETATPKGKVICLKELTKDEAATIEDKFDSPFAMFQRRFLSVYKSGNKEEQPTTDEEKAAYNAAMDKILYDAWEGNSQTDGKSNTAQIFKLLDEAIAAKAYSFDYIDCPKAYTKTYFSTCEVMWFKKHILDAKEGGYDDWYIPSIEELKVLLTEQSDGRRLYDVLNESISKQGGVLINSVWNMNDSDWREVTYASSSQATDEEGRIYIVKFKPQYEGDRFNVVMTAFQDKQAGIIRAIRQF